MKKQKIKVFVFVLSLFFTLSAHSKFKLIHSANDILTYRNTKGSVRVIKRSQKRALTKPIPPEDIRAIARGRLKAMEILGIARHTKISHIDSQAIPLKRGLVAYAWSGEYKDKRGKTHFFKEFISQGETWNVFADKKTDLRQASQMVRTLIK